MWLNESVEVERPLGGGQMLQHWHAEVGSPCGVQFRLAVLAGADEEGPLVPVGVPMGLLPWAPTFL